LLSVEFPETEMFVKVPVPAVTVLKVRSVPTLFVVPPEET
jgi:RNA polymerase-interacting CarD/CdnL/TRCF family regulator